MLKSKIVVWLLTVILVVIATAGLLLNASAGSVKFEDPIIKIIVEKGDVWRKAGDEVDFKKVSGSEQAFAGDIIKTGVNSVARISFFDTEEAMLDENSEVIITEGYIDANAPLFTQVKIKLRKGQVWARLLELLHPQAAFEVEAGTIVATVRGTSFNMSLGETYITVFVYENQVDVYNSGKQKALAQLAAGDEFKYNMFDGGYDTKHIEARDLMTSQRENPWIYNNMIMNKEFKKYLDYNRNYILEQVGALPGEKMYRLKLLAERLDRFLTLRKDSFNRNLRIKRAIEATALINAGKSQEAINFLHVNNINLRTCPEFTRLQALDTKLKERLIKYPDVKLFMMSSAFNTAERGFITNKLQQLNPTELNELQPPVLEQSSDVSPNADSTDESKQNLEPALGAGETGSPGANNNSTPAPAKEPAPVTLPAPTSEPAPTPTVSPKTEQKVVTPIAPVVQTPAPVKPVSLVVQADKVNLSAGGRSTLSAYLVYSDQSKTDVTKETKWSLSPDELTGEYAGILNGNVFSANDTGGKAYVKGSYQTKDGQSFSATIEITVLILNATNE